MLQFQSLVADTFVVQWSGGRWSELGEYKFPEANSEVQYLYMYSLVGAQDEEGLFLLEDSCTQ